MSLRLTSQKLRQGRTEHDNVTARELAVSVQPRIEALQKRVDQACVKLSRSDIAAEL
jgi:hypothetical protein